MADVTRRERPAPIRPIEDRIAARDFLIGLLAGDAVRTDRLSENQWYSLAEEALRHRIAPLVWRRLTETTPDDAPPAVLDRLRKPYLANAFRNAILFRETALAARALATESIPVIPLKGLHLARFVYDEPALRSMADLDIMVPRDRIRDADRILTDLGYGPLPRPDVDEHCAWSNHLPPLEKEGAEVLEVHYDIERPTSPFTIDVNAIWNATRQAEIDGAPVHLMSAEHLLIHLCLHLAYHHKFERASLKGLVDIATVTRQPIDWAELARTANAWNTGGFVYATLRLVRDVLRARVPEDALGRLDRSAEDEEVVAIARRFVLTPSIELSQSLVEIHRATGWRNRLSMFLRGVFLTPGRVRALYGDDDASRSLWVLYTMRITDLLRRQGGLLARIAMRTRAVSPVLDREKDRRRLERWAGYSDARSLAPPPR